MGDGSLIRLGAFLAILFMMAAWEAAVPRRRLTAPRRQRWVSNLGLVVLDATLVRLLVPAAHEWGLLNYLDLPAWSAVVVAVIMLDFIIYVQHVVFHAVPLLWRLHMVHHADTDIDVTTGLRFHPLEILLSMLGPVHANACLVEGGGFDAVQGIPSGMCWLHIREG